MHHLKIISNIILIKLDNVLQRVTVKRLFFFFVFALNYQMQSKFFYAKICLISFIFFNV